MQVNLLFLEYISITWPNRSGPPPLPTISIHFSHSLCTFMNLCRSLVLPYQKSFPISCSLKLVCVLVFQILRYVDPSTYHLARINSYVVRKSAKFNFLRTNFKDPLKPLIIDIVLDFFYAILCNRLPCYVPCLSFLFFCPFRFTKAMVISFTWWFTVMIPKSKKEYLANVKKTLGSENFGPFWFHIHNSHNPLQASTTFIKFLLSPAPPSEIPPPLSSPIILPLLFSYSDASTTLSPIVVSILAAFLIFWWLHIRFLFSIFIVPQNCIPDTLVFGFSIKGMVPCFLYADNASTLFSSVCSWSWY